MGLGDLDGIRQTVLADDAFRADRLRSTLPLEPVGLALELGRREEDRSLWTSTGSFGLPRSG
jgi:hypothetical protein